MPLLKAVQLWKWRLEDRRSKVGAHNMFTNQADAWCGGDSDSHFQLCLQSDVGSVFGMIELHSGLRATCASTPWVHYASEQRDSNMSQTTKVCTVDSRYLASHDGCWCPLLAIDPATSSQGSIVFE